MTQYRRNRVPGGTYFFTVNLQDRTSTLLTDQIHLLRNAVAKVRTQSPFHTDAWVTLPNHLHCIWTLPEGDHDFSSRWRDIKKDFSKHLPQGEPRSRSRTAKGERGIWQRRFWEHTIRDDQDYTTHINYIHHNPVRHGLTTQAADWPFSSFHRHTANNLLSPHP